jgi:hypothetical protein
MDVNGDGFADFLISQSAVNNNTGRIYLIFGGAKLESLIKFEETPAQWDGIVRIEGEAANSFAGNSAPAGDFNNDGFADFLIEESGAIADPPTKVGNVFLILGKKNMPETINLGHIGGQGFRINGRDDGSIFGKVVGAVGDLNGDGQPDFVLGENSRASVQPAPEAGHLYVIYGAYGDKKFLRGDANGDGVLDISDAVAILSYLFIGGVKPLCLDALDADDSGVLDITDVAYLLGYLFLAQPPPPKPFPENGYDPTRDVYNCLGFNP